MPENEEAVITVSPNNPCPFLRATVQQGFLNNDINPIGDIVKTIQRIAKASSDDADAPALAIRAIALIANGLGPLSVAESAFRGVRLNHLRDGPLDKRGAGSRILDARGIVSEEQLERLLEFASDKTSRDGSVESGLDADEITTFMNANFARAAGHRRRIDRKLMNGEWPVLLKFIGKQGQHGAYLSVSDVRNLFLNRSFPERIMNEL